MVPTLRILKAFFFIILMSLPALTNGQVLTDSGLQQTIQQTLDKIYNMEFDEAETLIRQIRTRYPQHPVGPILRATQLELQYLPVHENTAATAQFTQATMQGLEQAKRMLERNQKDPEAIFFALTAHSYLASLYNNQGEALKAVSESKKAYTYMKDGFTLMNKSTDFYFTTGLYNYYVERYPMDHPVVRPFMFFFQDGDMQTGLKQMDVATRKALFMRPVACYYLAHIYLKHENQPAKAIGYTKYLADKYPNNPLFAMINAETLLLSGRYAEAQPYVQQLRQIQHKLIPLAVRVFDGMLQEHLSKNDREAAANYQAALKLPYNRAYTMEYNAMAYAGLARIAARANDPNRAKEYYKRVLKISEYKGLVREAKNYTKS